MAWLRFAQGRYYCLELGISEALWFAGLRWIIAFACLIIGGGGEFSSISNYRCSWTWLEILRERMEHSTLRFTCSTFKAVAAVHVMFNPVRQTLKIF